MRIYQGTIADLDELASLFDAYRVFYGFPSDPELARSFLLERFGHSQSIIFIASFDGRAMGFVQLYPSFSSGRAARTLILNDLFVAPEARGNGAGKALLGTAADYGRSIGAVRLSLATATDNLAAQSLYEAEGWKRETSFVTYNFPLG